MKNLIYIAAIALIALTSCEKEAIEPTSTEQTYDEVFAYESSFNNAHLLESHTSGQGLNWVDLSNDTLIIVVDLQTGEYADFGCSVNITYIDTELNIVMGTCSNTKEGLSGTFKFELYKSFELDATVNNGEISKFYLY